LIKQQILDNFNEIQGFNEKMVNTLGVDLDCGLHYRYNFFPQISLPNAKLPTEIQPNSRIIFSHLTEKH
jgi:hypothetical protein